MPDSFNFGNLFPGYRDMQQQVATTDHIKAETANLLENTQGQKLENQQRKMQLDFTKRLQSLMQGQVTGTDPSKPRDVAAELESTADIYKAAGFVNEAASMDEKAALIRTHNASAARAMLGQQKDQLDVTIKRTKLASEMADSIQDADSWAAVTKGTPFEGTPYSPQMVQALKAAGETQHEKAIDARADNTRKDAHLKSLADIELANARRKRLDELNKKTESDMKTRAGKEAAASARAPTKDELRVASDFLAKHFPGLDKDSDDFNAARDSIAAEAKMLKQANPAPTFTWETAVATAAKNQAQNFRQVSKTFGGNKTKFTAGGSTPETALPLPDKEDDLVPGKFYLGGYKAVEGGLVKVDPETGEELEEEEKNAGEQ